MSPSFILRSRRLLLIATGKRIPQYSHQQRRFMMSSTTYAILVNTELNRQASYYLDTLECGIMFTIKKTHQSTEFRDSSSEINQLNVAHKIHPWTISIESSLQLLSTWSTFCDTNSNLTDSSHKSIHKGITIQVLLALLWAENYF